MFLFNNEISQTQIFSALFSKQLAFNGEFFGSRDWKSRSELERRLFNSGGIVYRDDNIKSNRLLRYALHEVYGILCRIRLKFGFIIRLRMGVSQNLLTWKKRVQPGWDIHVLYVQRNFLASKCTSVTQADNDDPEMKLLLTTLAQGSYWEKVDSKGSNKEVLPSAFGFNMERKDGKVRGRQEGRQDMVMVFDVDFDSRLAEMQILDDQEQAPIEV